MTKIEVVHLGHKLVPCGKPHGKITLNTKYGRRTRQLDGRLVHQYFSEDCRAFNTDGKRWWEVVQERCITGAV